MGRVNGRGQAVAVRGFNMVLGARRGSMSAQARRDAAEDAAEDAAFVSVLEQWLFNVYRPLTAVNGRELTAVSENALRALIKAYSPGQGFKDSKECERVIEQLQACLQESKAGTTMFTLAGDGDPDFAPGLTTPIVEALSRSYCVGSQRPETRAYLSTLLRVVGVHCFTGNEDVAHYQRLAPLCEAIGAFIEQTKDVDNEFLDMAARTLARVPTSVIAGPLRSWVDALAHRFADGKINKEERAYLQMIVRPPFTSVADSDSERQALVAPLAKVLAARKPVMRRRAQAKSVVR